MRIRSCQALGYRGDRRESVRGVVAELAEDFEEGWWEEEEMANVCEGVCRKPRSRELV